jgi:hypothetical protein
MRDDSCFATLEHRTRRLERWLRISIAGWLAVAALGVCAFTIRSSSQQPTTPASLKGSELVVVDPKGVERVRIGGNLPDATINGKRAPRGEKAAGVLLYDTTVRSAAVTLRGNRATSVSRSTRARARSHYLPPASKDPH